MSSVRADTGKAWMAFLLIPVLVAMACLAFAGATPAAAQDDETVTPEVTETAVPVTATPVGDEDLTPEPADTPSSDAPERPQTTPGADVDVIEPAPDGDDEPGPIEPAPADATEEQVIAPAPDGDEEPGLIAPAPEGAAEEQLIAPPRAGMGQSDDGGRPAAFYALLAAGGLAALTGVGVLTWRSRPRRA